MRLKKMRYPDLSGENKFNFIIPMGSLEQHGPFAPFGTDTYILDHIISEVEKKVPDLVILPTLEYSRSQEHRGFFGTVYLKEETVEKVLFDVCNSLYKKAEYIFITSFHHVDFLIDKFIKEKSDNFQPAKIINLQMCNKEDEKKIVEMLNGPIDGHAGNTEISNMLIIDESTVVMPTENDKKNFVENAFGTDHIAEKSSNGIADNHPKWVVNKEIGKKTLDIYVERMVQNLGKYYDFLSMAIFIPQDK